MKTRAEKIKEFLKTLETKHIDVAYHVSDEVNSFQDIVDQLENANAFNVEIIYYSAAMEYLTENDNSLRESLSIADELGFSPGNLSSETLASLLASRIERDKFYELKGEIDEFFEKLENEGQYFKISGYYKDDGSQFYDLIVKEYDDVEDGDEDVFFFGMSEGEIIEAIQLKEETVHNFVITDYEII